LPHAASLAERIQKKFKVKPDLIEGRNGIFDVKLDGELIFSKYELERFPEGDEVIGLIQERIN